MTDKLSIEDSFKVEFAKSLFPLECLVSEDPFFCTEEAFILALVACWDLVREYSVSSDDVLSTHFISTLHQTLASQIGAPEPGQFVDDGGVNGSWSNFTEELNVKEIIEGFGACDVIAQLLWGGHLPNLELTIGWLCINTLRLRSGYSPPFYPHQNIHEEHIECLEWALLFF